MKKSLRKLSHQELKAVAEAISPSLILLVLLAALLKYHDYGLLRLDVLVFGLLVFLLGLLMYAVASLRRETLYPLLIGLLLLKFADVQLDVILKLYLATTEYLPVPFFVVLLLSFFSLMACVWVIRRELGVLVSTVFGVILVSTLIFPTGIIRQGEVVKRPGAPTADLPTVLHLVLDEQIGIEGVPVDLEGGTELQTELLDLFLENGFQVYGRAYSIYSETQYSLASMMNGTIISGEADYIRPTGEGYRITRNKWLKSLSDRGYRIRVYQSGWLDLCEMDDVKVDYCFTYPTNSIQTLAEGNFDLPTKVSLVLPRILKGSISLTAWEHPQLSTLSALPLLEKLSQDIRKNPRGTVYLVHLMLPHFAYIYDPDCLPRRDVGTWLNAGNIYRREGTAFNSASQRREKYERYFEQARCLASKLGALFVEMEDMGVMEDATVLVHGDHGSRIALKDFRLVDPGTLTDRDMVDLFSTLFATKMPGGSQGYRREIISIQEVFSQEVLGLPLEGSAREIRMRPSLGKDVKFLSRPMVDFGAPP